MLAGPTFAAEIHQGIRNRAVLSSSDVPISTGKVVRIPRGGGLFNYYERVA